MSAGGSGEKPAANQRPDPDGQGDRSVISLIRDLHSGTLTADNLAVADRRRCVEYLTAEGHTVPEIAEVFKISDRTIQRDRDVIRQENALQPRPELLAEMAGNLYRQAEITASRLRRIARDRDTPAQVRVEAERVCFDTYCKLTRIFQDLGYLPSAPTAVVGHLRHQWAGDPDGGEVPNYTELRADAERIAAILSLGGQADPAVLRQIEKIQEDCNRLELASRLRAITDASVARMPALEGEATVIPVEGHTP